MGWGGGTGRGTGTRGMGRGTTSERKSHHCYLLAGSSHVIVLGVIRLHGHIAYVIKHLLHRWSRQLPGKMVKANGSGATAQGRRHNRSIKPGACKTTPAAAAKGTGAGTNSKDRLDSRQDMNTTSEAVPIVPIAPTHGGRVGRRGGEGRTDGSQREHPYHHRPSAAQAQGSSAHTCNP